MDQLITIQTSTINNDVVDTVNARELHEFLESKQEFANWIKNRIEKYGFIEGIDFIQFDIFIKSDSKARIEYHLTIDMAKELSMVERNEKGRIARRYFIECEKKLKEMYLSTTNEQPEMTIKSIIIDAVSKILYTMSQDDCIKWFSQFLNKNIIETETVVDETIKDNEIQRKTTTTTKYQCVDYNKPSAIFLTTSRLAKKVNLNVKEMYAKLIELKLIKKFQGRFVLTDKGTEFGRCDSYGYIKWDLFRVNQLLK